MKRKAVILTSSAVFGALAIAKLRRKGGMDMRGKTVLITGGSRGLGIAMAREFGRAGARLALCARSGEELAMASRDLTAAGAEVFTIACDIGSREGAQRAVEETAQRFGQLDVLVNNAGIIQVGPVETAEIEDFEQAMNTMFWGTVYVTLAALPHLKRQSEARIVNITSVGGKVSVPHLLPYCCAKFAAAAFSEGMRAELAKTGVKVVTIAPGLMRTGSYLNAIFKGDAESEAAWFSAASSLPGITISASRAARQIADATRSGRAEKVLTTPANVMARFHGLFPGLTADLLGMVNRLLPEGKQRSRTKTGGEAEILQKPWMRTVTMPGRKAAKEFLQPALRGKAVN